MYTKEKLYRVRLRRKSIKGWIYSVAAALFLIAMAVILLAAKLPEKELQKLSAGAMQAEGRVWELLRIPEKEKQRWEEKFQTYLVAVDAGHGGMDSGCLGSDGKAMEKDINLEISFLVRDKLEEKGFQVMMLRDADEFLDKEERVELANSNRADVYVSIHQNTYEGKDKSIGGIETWYDGGDAARNSKALAECVHREAIASTGAAERSLIDSDELYVLSKTRMPACLIETGFLSNPEECRRLSDAAYQEKLAEGIANGIMEYILKKSNNKFA